MVTSSPSAVASRKSTGRLYLWLGLLTGLLGPVLYMAQLQAKRLTVPWYLPILGTLGTILMVVALARGRSIWRILGVGLLGLLAVGEWFLSTSKLPAYTGPLKAGQPFPAFTTTLADGSPFSETNLKGEFKTVMVFFRGHW